MASMLFTLGLPWATLWLIATSIALFLGLIYLKSRKHLKKLPPGPPSFPILGSFPFLGKDLLKSLNEMRGKYGDIYTVGLPEPMVIINGYHAIRDAFVVQGNAFTGRVQNDIFTKELTKGLGIVSTDGDFWQTQRKFSHRILREFGMGKNIQEVKIQEEIRTLLTVLKRNENKPYLPMWDIMTAVSNIISGIVLGKHHQYDDAKFHTFLKGITQDLVTSIGPGSMLSLFPFLKLIPGDLFGYQSFKNTKEAILEFIKNHIKEHMETFNPEEVRDFIDAFLLKMDTENAAGNTNTTFHEQQMIMLVFELFGAGVETTTTALRWGIFLMACHPDVQAKVQEEIEGVVGTNRLPSMKDKPAMPYTDGTIHEILRFGTIVPTTFPHVATKDVILHGYALPKGTPVLANIQSAHNDEDIWPNPMKFNPNRFLDTQGKLDNREKMITFSMGKRVCLGESLARMEIFLVFTAILQRYTITLPPDQPYPSLKGNYSGATQTPHDCKVILRPREEFCP